MANSYKPYFASQRTVDLHLFWICSSTSASNIRRFESHPDRKLVGFDSHISHHRFSLTLHRLSSFALYNALPLPTPAYPPSLIFLAVYPSLPLIALFPYLNLYFFSLSHFFLSTGTSFPLPYKLQGLYPPSSSQGCYLRLVYRVL